MLSVSIAGLTADELREVGIIKPGHLKKLGNHISALSNAVSTATATNAAANLQTVGASPLSASHPVAGHGMPTPPVAAQIARSTARVGGPVARSEQAVPPSPGATQWPSSPDVTQWNAPGETMPFGNAPATAGDTQPQDKPDRATRRDSFSGFGVADAAAEIHSITLVGSPLGLVSIRPPFLATLCASCLPVRFWCAGDCSVCGCADFRI